MTQRFKSLVCQVRSPHLIELDASILSVNPSTQILLYRLMIRWSSGSDPSTLSRGLEVRGGGIRRIVRQGENVAYFDHAELI